MRKKNPKTEQQKNAKNNADLCTEWTKTTWRIFEETNSRGRNGSVVASLVADDDDDDDDTDDDYKKRDKNIFGIIAIFQTNT